MYKVMIVDDEKYIRISIRYKIDWEHFGFMVEAEAQNGQEALDIISQIQPDVVLVDIKMPEMDGMTFIKVASNLHPQCIFVVMSAYNDFTYAKSALKFGVMDYLLKPIEEEELTTLLKKILYIKNEEWLRKQTWDLKQNKKMFIRGNVVSIAFYLEESEETGRIIKAEIEECALSLEEDLIVYYLEDFSISDCYVYFINADKLNNELIHQLIERVWNVIPNKKGVAAYSEIRENAEARAIVIQSISSLKKKIFYPDRRILANNLPDEKISLEKKKIFQKKISNILQWGYRKEYDTALYDLADVIDNTIKKEYSVEIIEEFVNDILTLFRYLMVEFNDDTDFNIIFHKLKNKDYLLKYHSESELKGNLTYLAEQIFNSLRSTQSDDVISKIKAYIKANYSNNLNVSDIARKFYLNSNYLSTIFKEKTGINLISYIEGIRMEEAKRLLVGSNLTISEVALKTGYLDPSYFSKVFKKYAGLTPRQFREKERRATAK